MFDFRVESFATGFSTQARPSGLQAEGASRQGKVAKLALAVHTALHAMKLSKVQCAARVTALPYRSLSNIHAKWRPILSAHIAGPAILPEHLVKTC